MKLAVFADERGIMTKRTKKALAIRRLQIRLNHLQD